MRTLKRSASAGAVAAIVVSTIAMVGFVQPAEAVGGNCSSIRQEREDTGWNSFRVRARCSSLQADSRAQGVLDKSGGSQDPETPWFTQLNTYKYSPYTQCTPVVTCNNTRVKIEHV